MGPVHLHLFARQGAQPQERFGFRPGPVTGNQVPEVIWASGVAAILDHVVEPGSAQTRELCQGLENERQIGVDDRRAMDLLECRQSSLGEDACNAVAMDAQLAGEGADGPAFGGGVAQNLCFSFGGEGHKYACEVGDGESDSAESPGVPPRVRGDGSDNNARAPYLPAPSVRTGVEQVRPVGGNPDASLLAVFPGSGADVQRGHDGLAAWPDSASPQHERRCIVPDRHRRRSSSGGLDRRGCK
jgi:hypothetical protein